MEEGCLIMGERRGLCQFPGRSRRRKGAPEDLEAWNAASRATVAKGRSASSSTACVHGVLKRYIYSKKRAIDATWERKRCILD